ncbi:MAG: hypothetical protein GQ557_02060 [Mycoplasmataceae bacterium]|nr:hypothetical protein [Mycoplasmataceae bacterium]
MEQNRFFKKILITSFILIGLFIVIAVIAAFFQSSINLSLGIAIGLFGLFFSVLLLSIPYYYWEKSNKKKVKFFPFLIPVIRLIIFAVLLTSMFLIFSPNDYWNNLNNGVKYYWLIIILALITTYQIPLIAIIFVVIFDLINNIFVKRKGE